MKKFSFSLVLRSFKDSFKGFSEDKLTKLSASLAYYTVFSIGPLLIVIIFLSSIFLGKEAAEGSIFSHLQGLVGSEAADQVEDIIKNASRSNKGWVAATIGIITLLIGATSVFAEIQDSMNGIWGLKPKPKGGWRNLVKNRLLSFGVIGSLGFILLVSLAVTSLVEGLSGKLKDIFPDVTIVVFYIINLVLTLGIITLLFAVIYKVLPDAKLRWKDVLPGSVVTSILFMLGKLAITLYISTSDIGTTYGAAGSLVVLLVWVYYSSIILYFGAEFTKCYVIESGTRIQPNKYAVWAKEPVVPGAKTDENKSVSLHDQKTIPQQTQLPTKNLIDNPVKSEKMENKNNAGIVTVFFGLVLYLIHTSSKK